jgi:flagellar basal-body rod protein FlgB
MISGVTDTGSMPALERTMQFTGARHRLILHNIANLDTPNYRPKDVDPAGFQAALGEAIDRKQGEGRVNGRLRLDDTREIEFGPRTTLRPDTSSGNVLFHDKNDRDVERVMQGLAENALMFRMASDLYRSRSALLHVAISQRV